jgi:hypothetical protein
MNSEQMKTLGIIEVFLPIDDFPNYEVSNYGNVRNKLTGKLLTPVVRNSYQRIGLTNDFGRYHQNVHRLVLNTFQNNPENKPFVDHIDNNQLNNCLFNLRFANYLENNCNRSMRSDNVSGIKGVNWYKRINKWHVQIQICGNKLHIGYFDTIEDAKKARQTKAKELFGEYINKCEL